MRTYSSFLLLRTFSTYSRLVQYSRLIICHKPLSLVHLSACNLIYMCRHTIKPTKWPVRPAKTQINLGIRPVWSEYSLSAWRNLGSLGTHWADSEDSDGEDSKRMLRLIWVFAGRTGHFVGFVMLRLICFFLWWSDWDRKPLPGLKHLYTYLIRHQNL